MLGPSRIFPTRPDREVEPKVIRVQAPRAARRSRPSFSQMARRADWLAEMWSEFPEVANRHRSYARAFRGASAGNWYRIARLSHAEADRSRMRRMAWRAYRRATIPTPSHREGMMFLAAQHQKVDTFWAREMWAAIGGDSTRMSVLQARDWELQQICDAFPSGAPMPGILGLIRLAWKWLRHLLPF